MWRRNIAAVLSVLAAIGAVAVTTGVFPARMAYAAPSAQDRAAARAFGDGQKAFKEGDYVRAAESFESAYKQRPHHAPLWNAARSWQKAGEDVRAANLYARYLREAPEGAPDRDQATVSLKELSARLGRIELHAAGVEKMRLDGKDVPADVPVVYVAPGDHAAEGDDHGARVRRVVSVAAGQRVSVTLAPDAPKPVTPAPATEGPPKPIAPPAPPPEAHKPLPPALAITGAVLTLVAGGFTIGSGLDTVSKRDAFLEERSQTNLDTAGDAQTRTNILLGTTGALALVTGVVAIFFTDWSGSPPASESGASVGSR